MEHGDMVKLSAYEGMIERKVVEVRGDVVLVCREPEYHAARRGGRAPVVVGFPLDDVIEVTENSPGES